MLDDIHPLALTGATGDLLGVTMHPEHGGVVRAARDDDPRRALTLNLAHLGRVAGAAVTLHAPDADPEVVAVLEFSSPDTGGGTVTWAAERGRGLWNACADELDGLVMVVDRFLLEGREHHAQLLREVAELTEGMRAAVVDIAERAPRRRGGIVSPIIGVSDWTGVHDNALVRRGLATAHTVPVTGYKLSPRGQEMAKALAQAAAQD